jgi:predicted methyltransferase
MRFASGSREPVGSLSMPALPLLLAAAFLALSTPLASQSELPATPPPAAAPAPPALAPPALPAPPPARRPAAVMSYHGAEWLERAGREAEERPSALIRELQAMGLKPGDVVAEVGCGTGYISRLLAAAVGPTGKVYCEDIQPEMVQLARQRAAAAGLGNVVFVLGAEDDPRLPRQLAWVVLVDVYHELQRPEPMLARIRESLAPGGRVALAEYRAEGDSAAHIKPEHRMSVEQVLGEWTRAGFLLVKRIETLPEQHLFIFSARRGARPLP